MGRLIERQMGYQEVVPLHEPMYIKQVSPRGWTYKAPIVVLVNRWTASMGEGIAIGLDGMKRATIVGTRMAALNGGIFNLQLPQTKIGVAYAGERLNHINGTPRENFVPAILVNPIHRNNIRFNDPILDAGYRRLMQMIRPGASTREAGASIRTSTPAEMLARGCRVVGLLPRTIDHLPVLSSRRGRSSAMVANADEGGQAATRRYRNDSD
jgi:hypothetical protein